MYSKVIDLKMLIKMVVSMEIMTKEMAKVLLEIGDKAEEILEIHSRFNKSPNVRCPRVASKSVDKDKMRCHYCNEFGHFIRDCSKRNRDEEEARHFSGMNSDYYENDGYDDVYDEDYDDEGVCYFKQLKELGPSTPSTPSNFQTPQYIPNH